VLEIGPGKGLLTRQLAEHACQVIAIEKDPSLAERLCGDLSGTCNVVVFKGDFLQFPLPSTSYNVFANIPFNITSEIVTRLTGSANPPEEAFLVMQHEAAERFVGTRRESLPSILLKPWFELSITYRFKRTDFVPVPRVDIVLLRFNKRGPPLLSTSDVQHYRDFVVYGFTAWKPNIGEAYRRIFGRQELRFTAAALGLDLNQRPSAVSIDQWLGLYQHFQNSGSSRAKQVVFGAEQRLREQQSRLSKDHRTRVRQRK
jgi:23S rRNA (adenine-N6)-dimethyltransferase